MTGTRPPPDTAREGKIAPHTVRGRGTRDIATARHLTPATVQDHLRSVFGQTGVRSRRDLVAVLLTPRPATAARPPR
ncbi:LuxR C-terminal-related transcriptional regulator [Streptomyces sp. x-80]|uniref:LuxR C-terminal-related transcriptional regulator n=1 Tax=Streptomyces sp. x-80 TaxID=2789282 RepID=UPI00397F8D8F